MKTIGDRTTMAELQTLLSAFSARLEVSCITGLWYATVSSATASATSRATSVGDAIRFATEDHMLKRAYARQVAEPPATEPHPTKCPSCFGVGMINGEHPAVPETCSTCNGSGRA